MGGKAAITATMARETSAGTILTAGFGTCGCLDGGQFRVGWSTESGGGSFGRAGGGAERLFTYCGFLS